MMEYVFTELILADLTISPVGMGKQYLTIIPDFLKLRFVRYMYITTRYLWGQKICLTSANYSERHRKTRGKHVMGQKRKKVQKFLACSFPKIFLCGINGHLLVTNEQYTKLGK